MSALVTDALIGLALFLAIAGFAFGLQSYLDRSRTK